MAVETLLRWVVTRLTPNSADRSLSLGSTWPAPTTEIRSRNTWAIS